MVVAVRIAAGKNNCAKNWLLYTLFDYLKTCVVAGAAVTSAGNGAGGGGSCHNDSAPLTPDGKTYNA